MCRLVTLLIALFFSLEPLMARTVKIDSLTALPVCKGEITKFTIKISGVITGVLYTLNWDFGDGTVLKEQFTLADSNILNNTCKRYKEHKYNSAKLYNVNVQLSLPEPLNIKSTITDSIRIIAPPTADITYTIDGNLYKVYLQTYKIDPNQSLSDVKAEWSYANTDTSLGLKDTLYIPLLDSCIWVDLKIIDRFNCRFIDSIHVCPDPNALFKIVQDICYGDLLVLDDLSAVPGNLSNKINYTWYIDEAVFKRTAGDTSYTFEEAGTHTVKLVLDTFNVVLDSLIDSVNVHKLPVIKLIETVDFICKGEMLLLRFLIDDLENELYDVKCEGEALIDPLVGLVPGQKEIHMLAKPNQSGEYSFTVTSPFGCMDSFSVSVNVFDLFEKLKEMLIIPTAFTPNDDTYNDKWQIIFAPDILASQYGSLGNVLDIFQLSVYDKWGNSIYDSADKKDFWDGTDKRTGKAMPTGTYYYTIRLNTGIENPIECLETFDLKDIDKGMINILRND